jgi:hypothetical protein
MKIPSSLKKYGKVEYLSPLNAPVFEKVTRHYTYHILSDLPDKIVSGFKPGEAIGFYIIEYPEFEEIEIIKEN